LSEFSNFSSSPGGLLLLFPVILITDVIIGWLAGSFGVFLPPLGVTFPELVAVGTKLVD
jgi:hypothetical protein